MLLQFVSSAGAADFGTRGGLEPGNIDEVVKVLQQDPYDMELLICFGTSKGGSAGHIALPICTEATIRCIRQLLRRPDPTAHDGFYNDDLMIEVPREKYLFKTTSSLGDTASFGPGFRRDLQAVHRGCARLQVPVGEREALTAFFNRINEDYRNRAKATDYHRGEVVYDYMDLNCAKALFSGWLEAVVQSFEYLAGDGDILSRDAGKLLDFEALDLHDQLRKQRLPGFRERKSITLTRHISAFR